MVAGSRSSSTRAVARGTSSGWRISPPPRERLESARPHHRDAPSGRRLRTRGGITLINADPSLAAAPLGAFSESLASAEPVPGGGSAAAIVGSVAASLLVMVARLTRGRERYAAHEPTAADVEEHADRLRGELLELASRDALAYRSYVDARRLPRGSDDEVLVRQAAIDAAAAEAISVPLLTANAAGVVTSLAVRLAAASNPNAASDVGCAAHFGAAAARAALLNVRINVPALPDAHPLRERAAAETDRILTAVASDERAALELVERAMG